MLILAGHILSVLLYFKHRLLRAYKFNLIVFFLLLKTGMVMSQYSAISKVETITNNNIVKNIDSLTLQDFRIKKNHHSPHNRRIVFHKSNEFSIVCMFDESCRYSFTDKRSEIAINKIFGYSFGYYHHNNSFRLGWRCKEGQIEILAYWYIKHKHFSKHLFFVNPGKRFFINVKTDYKKVVISYLVDGSELSTKEILFNPDKVNLKRWGYINYPYFGGKQKAPHDMTIRLKVWLSGY